MGSYETGWRAVRGLLGATCLGEPAATIVLFALSWGTALEMLPSLDLAPNPKEWGARGALHRRSATRRLCGGGERGLRRDERLEVPNQTYPGLKRGIATADKTSWRGAIS